jgi:hypothetical protein
MAKNAKQFREIVYGGASYPTLFQGALWKKERSKSTSLFSRRNWKRRYFALLKPPDGSSTTNLVYFSMDTPQKERGGVAPIGGFVLNEASVVRKVVNKSYLYCFELENDVEVFRLRANTEIEMKNLVKLFLDLFGSLQLTHPNSRESGAPMPLPVGRHSEMNRDGAAAFALGTFFLLLAHFVGTIVPSQYYQCMSAATIVCSTWVFFRMRSSPQSTEPTTSEIPLMGKTTADVVVNPANASLSVAPFLRTQGERDSKHPSNIIALRYQIINTDREEYSTDLQRYIENTELSDQLLSRIIRFFGGNFGDHVEAAAKQFHGFTSYMENPIKLECLLDKVTPEFVEQFMSSSGIVMLGNNSRTITGKRVLLTRPAVLQNVAIDDLILFSVFFLLYTSGDDDWGLNGFFVVHDLKDFSVRHAYRLKAVDWKKYSPANCFPMRMLGIVVANQPTWMSWLWTIACQVLPAKLQKRVTMLNNMEALYDIVGKNALPESFGGTNDSTRQEFVEEMKSTWAVKCRKLRPIIGSSATVEKKKRHSQ